MKKLILAAALAIAAFVVAPISSASAAEFEPAVLTGTCSIEGKAEFTDLGLVFGAPRKTRYNFKEENVHSQLGKAAAGKCVEGTAKKSGGGEESTGEFKIKSAEVIKGNQNTLGTGADNGELECGASSVDSTTDTKFERAEAKLEVESKKTGKTYKAKSYFRFKAAGVGSVVAELNSKFGGGGKTAEGSANFLGPETELERGKCTPNPGELSPFPLSPGAKKTAV